MTDLDLYKKIIYYSTKHSYHTMLYGFDYSITQDLTEAKKLQKQGYVFCYIFKDKQTGEYLKVGQATGVSRIEDHDGIYPGRKYKASTLSLSMMLDEDMFVRLFKDGVNTSVYKEIWHEQMAKTRIKTDQIYLEICKNSKKNKTFKEWIAEHCERYIVCIKPIPGIQNKIVQNMMEGILQYNLNPKYEGHSAHAQKENN